MSVRIVIDRRIRGIRPSAALSFNERVQALRREGREIYHFGFGESRFPVSAGIKSALIRNAGETSYEPVGGGELLKNNIASYWNNKFGTSFKSSNVLVGAGSKILLHDALRVIGEDYALAKMGLVFVQTDTPVLIISNFEFRKSSLRHLPSIVPVDQLS